MPYDPPLLTAVLPGSRQRSMTQFFGASRGSLSQAVWTILASAVTVSASHCGLLGRRRVESAAKCFSSFRGTPLGSRARDFGIVNDAKELGGGLKLPRLCDLQLRYCKDNANSNKEERRDRRASEIGTLVSKKTTIEGDSETASSELAISALLPPNLHKSSSTGLLVNALSRAARRALVDLCLYLYDRKLVSTSGDMFTLAHSRWNSFEARRRLSRARISSIKLVIQYQSLHRPMKTKLLLSRGCPRSSLIETRFDSEYERMPSSSSFTDPSGGQQTIGEDSLG
ncbi:hypothetical protein SCHPADRAFT_896985 [Schizopora paradoxa]|uniref:Uncharacterized protein n=1 Tax=Schizopora paradoxa TaxID=27342 RepID=A0A0H2RI44_9AGAM|nr:hypothetical protein SCHPADRAFT_896985 [Schizopora paradoxa]